MPLFLCAGFALGTMLCATAQNYHVLLLRIVTGVFSGVLGPSARSRAAVDHDT
jgi:predicted MFS family arabinose efflux permease